VKKRNKYSSIESKIFIHLQIISLNGKGLFKMKKINKLLNKLLMNLIYRMMI